MEIQKIIIEPVYKAGDIVKGKIVIKNTSPVTIPEFEIKTQVVNNDYEWMGDIAKREYLNKYNSNIKSNELYVVVIQVTIPEKVLGMKPVGKYTLSVSLIVENKVIDTKIVNTEVI